MYATYECDYDGDVGNLDSDDSGEQVQKCGEEDGTQLQHSKVKGRQRRQENKTSYPRRSLAYLRMRHLLAEDQRIDILADFEEHKRKGEQVRHDERDLKDFGQRRGQREAVALQETTTTQRTN